MDSSVQGRLSEVLVRVIRRDALTQALVFNFNFVASWIGTATRDQGGGRIQGVLLSFSRFQHGLLWAASQHS